MAKGQPRGKERLKELHFENYLRYRKSRMTDRQIARLYGVSEKTLQSYKAENFPKMPVGYLGLIGKYFPDEIKKMIKTFKKYHSMGWKQIYIAKELGMSKVTLAKFIRLYLPEYREIEQLYCLTKVGRETARKNKIAITTVQARIRAGEDPFEAVTRPTFEGAGGLKPGERTGRKWSDLSEEHKRIALENGLKMNTVSKRLDLGWSDELAITKLPGKKERK